MGAMGRAITRWVIGSLVALVLIGGLSAIVWLGLGLAGLHVPPGLYVLGTIAMVLLALNQGNGATRRPAPLPTPPRRRRSEDADLVDLLIRREVRRRGGASEDGPDGAWGPDA
jgi:hypothetical protein